MSSGRKARLLQAMLPPALFALGGWQLHGGLVEGAALGVLGWLAVRLGPVRIFLLADHRVGVAASRTEDWEEALEAFEASERAWRGRGMLDRRRALLLGSSGPWPYLGLARYNQAACLTRLGRSEEARARLVSLLQQQPGMTPARELLSALPAPGSDSFQLGDFADLDDGAERDGVG